MTATVHPPAGEPRCLNCGETLHGAFCAACGQRSVPANPTVSELAGDAWQELSGYDGRIAATFRGLLHPGKLTIEYVQGRRARYLPPVRLYLIASVVYFIAAAAAPESQSGLRVWNDRDRGNVQLTAEDRAELEADLASRSWPVRVLLRAIAEDPAAFRARLFTIMPRVFFGMLPVFAGIFWLFYRRRRFPTVLVFAAHLHAFGFLMLSISEAVKFSETPAIITPVSLIVLAIVAGYAVRAQKAVFGGGWPMTLAKTAAIAVLYLISLIPAFMIVLLWASMV